MQSSVEYLEQQVNELESAIRHARASLNISPNTADMNDEDIPIFSPNNPYISPQSSHDDIKEEIFTSLDETLIDGDGDGDKFFVSFDKLDSDSYLRTPSSGTSDFYNSTSESSQASQEVVLFSPMSSSIDQENQDNEHTWSITVSVFGYLLFWIY
jgi:hypothetical protein